MVAVLYPNLIENTTTPPTITTSIMYTRRQYTVNPAITTTNTTNNNNSRAADIITNTTTNTNGAGDSLDPGRPRPFSIVSYNILAEVHRVRWDYSYTGEEFLRQEYRHSVLMQELRYLDGDVVCLQEVNPRYFTDTLLPDMNRLGYDGLLKRRTTDYYDEGEATFFRTNVFDLMSSKGVSLTECAHRIVEMSDVAPTIREAAKNYLNQADVVLVTNLRCKASGRVLTVGNVHQWWEDNRHLDVKTIQALCAVQETVAMSGLEGAHVLCGDFNTDCSTPTYQLLRDGHLSHSSVRALQCVNKLQLNNGFSKAFIDHFKGAFHHASADLKSAYCTVKGSEPEVTCYTDKGYQLDYIFYSANTLDLLGVLDVVDPHLVAKTGGLPSEDFPSDHLSLKTCFAFR